MTQDALSPLLLLDQDVPAEVATSLKTNLMTVESAKNNPTLKIHFRASTLNAVDRDLDDLIKDFDFEDGELQKFKAETNTHKRMAMVSKSLKAMEAAALTKGSKDPAIKDAHDKMKLEVERLNTDMATLRTDSEGKLTEARNGFEKELMTEGINTLLGSKKYANKEIDLSTNVTLARTLLADQLKTDGVTLVRKDGKIVMVRTDNPELEYMAENKKVELGSYADQLLGTKKLIEVTAADKGSAGGKTKTFNKDSQDANDKQAIPASAGEHYASEIAALNGG